jgi:Zn ribbon nucleic-acid-binding protein
VSESLVAFAICDKCGSKDNIHAFVTMSETIFRCYKCCYGKDPDNSDITFECSDGLEMRFLK